jgi:hypothetical protein
MLQAPPASAVRHRVAAVVADVAGDRPGRRRRERQVERDRLGGADLHAGLGASEVAEVAGGQVVGAGGQRQAPGPVGGGGGGALVRTGELDRGAGIG